MPRRNAASKRQILPDSIFGRDVVAKFINCVMLKGKKSVAEKIVYGALLRVVQREGGEGLKGIAKISDFSSMGSQQKESVIKIFEKAIERVSPTVEVRSRRVGGSTYQVPVEVRPDRRLALAMRWIIGCARKRNEGTMVARLANEILDVLAGRGGAIKKLENLYGAARANQAFAHYRW